MERFTPTSVSSYEWKLQLLFQNPCKYFGVLMKEFPCGNIHLKGDDISAIKQKCFVEKFEHPV